jgi:predicted nucleotidyltransferase
MSPESHKRPDSPALDIRDYNFFNQLKAVPCIDAIYIHGSRSRGDYTENSDLDLAIVCPEATTEDWAKIQQIVNSGNLLLKIDLVRLDTLSSSNVFYKHIHDTKSLLYYRTTAEHIDVLKIKIAYFDTALKHLQEEVAKPAPQQDEQANARLKDFHFHIDLFIRSLVRRALLAVGIREYGPVLIMRYAVQMGWVKNRLLWEDILAAWQYTKETCAPEVRRDLLARLPEYTAAIKETFEIIKQVEKELSQPPKAKE